MPLVKKVNKMTDKNNLQQFKQKNLYLDNFEKVIKELIIRLDVHPDVCDGCYYSEITDLIDIARECYKETDFCSVTPESDYSKIVNRAMAFRAFLKLIFDKIYPVKETLFRSYWDNTTICGVNLLANLQNSSNDNIKLFTKNVLDKQKDFIKQFVQESNNDDQTTEGTKNINAIEQTELEIARLNDKAYEAKLEIQKLKVEEAKVLNEAKYAIVAMALKAVKEAELQISQNTANFVKGVKESKETMQTIAIAIAKSAEKQIAEYRVQEGELYNKNKETIESVTKLEAQIEKDKKEAAELEAQTAKDKKEAAILKKETTALEAQVRIAEANARAHQRG